MLREDDFLIELCGVYKKTGADYALTNISFEIAQGEAAAVLGPQESPARIPYSVNLSFLKSSMVI
jgi:ABC-type transporter Mla maintaining outer membrane lipid asymmetry ATPase subunit MlaF